MWSQTANHVSSIYCPRNAKLAENDHITRILAFSHPTRFLNLQQSASVQSTKKSAVLQAAEP